MRLRTWWRRTWQPLTITTPQQLLYFFEQQAHTCIPALIDSHQTPDHIPLIPEATITAILWQHSLYHWTSIANQAHYLPLCTRAEALWMERYNTKLLNQLGDKRANRLLLSLRSNFLAPKSLPLPQLSEELYQWLVPYLAPHASTGMLRMWCSQYQTKWQEQVCSFNIIRIMLL